MPEPSPGLGDVRPRGYAVISSDYAVTSVGLLADDGSLLRRALIDSGSRPAGLVTALSGDVGLPTRSGEPGVLVLLDRFRTDVVTRIDLGSGEVIEQIKTHASNAEADVQYSSNPHDYVVLNERDAWLSRYEPNQRAAAGDRDRGADLIRIDRERASLGSERIGFERWNGRAERRNPDTGQSETVDVLARPSKIVRLARLLVVGIDVFSPAYDAIGEGLVALVDPELERVAMLELPGLEGCGQVAPVPDDPERVVVGCTGFVRGAQRDGAGIALLRLDGDALSIEHVWRAADDPSSALAVYGVLALGASEVLAVAAGAAEVVDADGAVVGAETRDQLVRVELASGAQTRVLEAEGRFVLGTGAYDASRGLLLWPDASIDARGAPTRGVRRFQRQEGGSFEELAVTELDAVLPVREVRAFE